MTAKQKTFLVGSFVLGAANVFIGCASEDSDVLPLEGLHMFIGNSPAMSDSYTVIQVLREEYLGAWMGQLNMGKTNVTSIVEEVLKINVDHKLYAQLGNFTAHVRAEYPHAQGLIISQDANSCELIAFS